MLVERDGSRLRGEAPCEHLRADCRGNWIHTFNVNVVSDGGFGGTNVITGVAAGQRAGDATFPLVQTWGHRCRPKVGVQCGSLPSWSCLVLTSILVVCSSTPWSSPTVR